MSKRKPLTINRLVKKSVERTNSKIFDHKLEDWSLTDWGCALAGEVGELCNFLKKVRRNTLTLEKAKPDIEKELADCQIYLVLLAAKANVDLEKAIIEKFNEVSKKRNCKVKL